MKNLYRFLRPLLFRFDAEKAHHLGLKGLKLAHGLGMSPKVGEAGRPVHLMGLTFPNAVGLAAGLDKNGEYIDALATLGFGSIEVGTVTPRPQPGNPRPRLFRLPRAEGIINRMGFNNKGVEHLLAQVKAARYEGILGINIGKNFDTPIERALDDYLIGLRAVYPYASYVTINISSPNTKNLRQLQEGRELANLLAGLKAEQGKLKELHGKYVPLVVKIAPDLDAAGVEAIAALLLKHDIDGVIATNTTLSREGVEGLPHADEAGGLSGAPLTRASTEIVRQLAGHLQGRLPIIAAGGIMGLEDARAKLAAGASLVQVYSGLIYRGPALVAELVEGL